MDYFKSRFVDELNAEGEVEIAGNTWTRHEVLETMDKTAAADLFTGWVGEAKLAARARVDEALRQTGCRARFPVITRSCPRQNQKPARREIELWREQAFTRSTIRPEIMIRGLKTSLLP